MNETPKMNDSGTEESSVGTGRAKTLPGRIFAGFLFLLLVGPMVYGLAFLLLSTPVNRAFHYEKECTIIGGAAGSSGSKSSSGSYYIYVKSSDCNGMEFVGSRRGLSMEEVADRIDLLEGQTVTVDVGHWQLPYSRTIIVGIEGLDLSHDSKE